MEKSGDYLSIPEAAKLLGLSRIAVYKQVAGGKIKAIRIGRNFAIPRSEIKAPAAKPVSEDRKQALEQGVRKVVREYGETLKLLGNE